MDKNNKRRKSARPDGKATKDKDKKSATWRTKSSVRPNPMQNENGGAIKGVGKGGRKGGVWDKQKILTMKRAREAHAPTKNQKT